MDTETSLPYSWLKKIPEALVELDEIPLLGAPPPFPWEALEQQLAETFQLKNLTFTRSEWEWREEARLFNRLGKEPTPLYFTFPGLAGYLCWVMSKDEISRLMSFLLTKKASAIELSDPAYQKGFYQFLALELINTIGQLDFDPTLTPQIDPKEELPTEAALCMDISAMAERRKFFGRLILSPELRASLKQKYTPEGQERLLNPALANQVGVTLHLEMGKTTLSAEEWSNVKPGDFLLLDKCSWDPEKKKARVFMTIQGIPFFRGRIRKGSVKILENPLTHQTEE